MRCTRTNNDVEGWHNTRNKGRPANMNLECLIEILASEAKTAPSHAKLLSEERILRMLKKKLIYIYSELVFHWYQ